MCLKQSETMGATFWSSPSRDLSCHFDPSPLGRGLHHHDEVAGRWSLSPHGLQPTSLFPPSFPAAQATVQRDSSLLQADYPPSPLVISKDGPLDGSVPSLFGAGVYVTCFKCNTSNSLSFSTGPIASSFTAETFALKQGLDWCTSHLLTCKFQSVLFLTDSQSALYPFISPLLSPA